MDALVKSLPTVIIGRSKISVIFYTNEQNVMTTTQVTAAKSKGWTPQYFNGSTWREYFGSEDTDGITEVKNERVKSEKSADAVYNLSGQSVGNGKLKPGIYIVNGKKVMVK